MASKSQVPFRLKTETASAGNPRLHQVDLFHQWYEQYVVQETEDTVPLPPTPQPKTIKAWWLKDQYA